MKQIKVLVVDDSAVVRQVMLDVLGRAPDIKVIGTASDPIFAMQKMNIEWPDVITLDVEMALTLLERYEIPIKAKHLGGDGHRKLMLDVWSGDVWLKHQPLTEPRKEPRW